MFKKFSVINHYTGEEVFSAATFEECSTYCGKIAYTENYGLCRTWKEDDIVYMDCGATTFEIIGH